MTELFRSVLGSPSITKASFGDGTKEAPSIYFTSDIDTGVFLQADGVLGITAGSVECARFPGVLSAVNCLVLTPSVTGVTPNIAVDGTDTNVALTISTKGGGTITEAMRIDSSQRVMIGTTSTTSNLEVAESVAGQSADILIRHTDNTNAASRAVLQLATVDDTGGDQIIIFSIANVGDWSMGVDNSDGDKFKIATTAALESSTKLTIERDGTATFANDVFVSNNAGVVVGHTAKVSVGGIAQLQVLGTTGSDSAQIMGRWSNNATPPKISFAKSRGATIGTSVIVNDDDVVGLLRFCPDDGNDFTTLAAQFGAEVDDASPAIGDIGMAFTWEQMDGAGGALVETMRLSAAGTLVIAGKLGIGVAAPLAGLHATGLVEGTGDFKDMVAVFQGATGGTQTGFLFTSDDAASDVWLAFRGVPADTNQWLMGARFFSGDTFAIGYGSKDGDMTFPLDTGAKFVITTGGLVGIGTTTPATSALLELSSTTGALLLTRLTTVQRDALTAVNGMILYNTTTATMQGRTNGSWTNL